LRNIKIAIDGPAGAGKSTIARQLSKRLGIIYLDTGAMYRAVALLALNEGIRIDELDGVDKLKDCMKNLNIEILFKDGEQKVLLNGKDVTKKIRTSQISEGASKVASVGEVRKKLVEMQRHIANENSVVMDGRDIGTSVLPNANLKVYLTASIDARAQRRYDEEYDKGIIVSLDAIRKSIEERDYNDINRDISPLRMAEDAVGIDTSHMSINEVVENILKLIEDIKND
jgi:CMP/dCMP kinase